MFHIFKFTNKINNIYNGIYTRNKVIIKLHPSSQIFLKKHNEKSEIEMDEKTIQHLERLSLIHIDNPELLKNLNNSIQFASNIINVDTENIDPLYTVLEQSPLQMRLDEVIVEHTREEILQTANYTEEDYYVAPPGNVSMD